MSGSPSSLHYCCKLLLLLLLMMMMIRATSGTGGGKVATERTVQDKGGGRGGLGWLRHARTYQSDEEIPVLWHSLTSTQTFIPKDPCRELPGLCGDDSGNDNTTTTVTTSRTPRMHYHPETLSLFHGDAVFASPIPTVRMLRDEYCRQLAWTPPLTKQQVQAWQQQIQQEYSLNWHLDGGLPAAEKTETEATITTRYWQGTKLGFVINNNNDYYMEEDRENGLGSGSSYSGANKNDGNHYVNNHWNLEIMYSPFANGYRITRFTIEPFSIHHEIMTDNDDGPPTNLSMPPFPLKDPIPSCNPSRQPPVHTTFNMIHYQTNKKEKKHHTAQPLETGTAILWTCDVTWIYNHDLKWSNRWDIYLSLDDAVPARVHWLGIINSSVVMMVCFALVLVIWRRNISGYRRVSVQDAVDTPTPPPPPWHKIKHYVFRPPPYPALLAVCCGTGVHLVVTTALLILSGILGLADQSRTGSLMLTGLVWYALTGGVNGLCTVYYAKSFGGSSVYKTAAVSAVAFPMIGLLVTGMSQVIYRRHNSTAASSQLLVIPIFLWCLVMLPSHALGAIVAARRLAPCRFPVPVAPADQVRPIPPRTASTWFFSALYLFIVAQYPFISIFVEYYYILASTWLGYYYDAFFFAGIVFLVTALTQAVTAVLFVYYFCFRKENYCWWWKSFWFGVWTGITAFYYSTVYAAKNVPQQTSGTSDSNVIASALLFYGFMMVVCLAMGLAMGAIGLIASLSFSCWLYSVFDEEETPEDGTVELAVTA